MKINNPENYETNILLEINDYLLDTSPTFGVIAISEMTDVQRKFLNGIIRQNKPQKVVEFGVAAGGSSAIILNAIKDIEGAKLYSVDYSEKYYRDPSRETGWLVKEKLNHLADKWKLYTGGIGAKFIEEIGADIDICLLDTMHINPGEFIDFLIVLPYMRKGGIVILHDTILHLFNGDHVNTNGTLFAALKGKKYTVNEETIKYLGNIGAVILDDDIMDRVFDYFYLLNLPWVYMPTNEDLIHINSLFSKHYDKKLVELFISTSLFYKEKFAKNEAVKNNEEIKNRLEESLILSNERINYLENKFKKLLNAVAWWIPIRKWRDNFRNRILN